MKPLHTLAIIGALAAGPVLAQEYPSSQPDAAATESEASDQALDRQTMARIQQQLKQGGYYNGQVDGMYGGQTRQALAQWQRDQGIPPTGQLNARSLTALDLGSDAQQAGNPQAGQGVRSPKSQETPRRD